MRYLPRRRRRRRRRRRTAALKQWKDSVLQYLLGVRLYVVALQARLSGLAWLCIDVFARALCTVLYSCHLFWNRM
jgi:hypothetical protein